MLLPFVLEFLDLLKDLKLVFLNTLLLCVADARLEGGVVTVALFVDVEALDDRDEFGLRRLGKRS